MDRTVYCLFITIVDLVKHSEEVTVVLMFGILGLDEVEVPLGELGNCRWIGFSDGRTRGLCI